MSNRFSYKQDMITSTEEYFQKIDTSGLIGEVAEEFSRIISNATGISSAACKGFFWKSVKNWQGERETEIDEIFSDLSSDDRNKEMATIMIDFEEQMTKVLTDPEEAIEFKGVLVEAFQEFKNTYKFTHFNTPSKGSSNPSSNPRMSSNPSSLSSNPKMSSNPSSLSSNPKMSSNPRSNPSSMSSNPNIEGKSMDEIRREAEKRAKDVLEGAKKNKR